MLKFKRGRRGEKGYTLIELLIVCAIIGIILAIAIPNLIKARISANEANGRKAMQTMRDAEGEYFEQDMDNNGSRDFTDLIGLLDVTADPGPTLRCPDPGTPGGCVEADALIDNSFVGAITSAGDGNAASTADCTDTKAGYCVGWTEDTASPVGLNDVTPQVSVQLQADFGWEASMASAFKSGRRDFGVWGDGVIRCSVSSQPTSGAAGLFDATRDGTNAIAAGACD